MMGIPRLKYPQIGADKNTLIWLHTVEGLPILRIWNVGTTLGTKNGNKRREREREKGGGQLDEAG